MHDESWFARRDAAFVAWLKARWLRFNEHMTIQGAEDLAQSAFESGIRFAEAEAERAKAAGIEV